MNIRVELNGEIKEIETQPLRRLIDVLREDFGLTGTKEGCGEGECGACSVLLNGRVVASCIIPIGSVHNAKIETIEGLRKTSRFEHLKNACIEVGAVQCGFCTPGMIISAEALLREKPNPTKEQIRIAISGNLCRCTGYTMIVDAIALAAEKGKNEIGKW